MQKFRVLQSVDICKQIFLYLSSYNFVQEIITQMLVWSSPLCRAAQEYSYKIYFAIFGHSYKVLQILEAFTIFWELKQLKND
jgi:hypothetical protein